MSGLDASVGDRLPIPRTLDEQADSAARKCLMHFGPNNNPRLNIGPRNQIMVDAGVKVHLIDDLAEYNTARRFAPRCRIEQLIFDGFAPHFRLGKEVPPLVMSNT